LALARTASLTFHTGFSDPDWSLDLSRQTLHTPKCPDDPHAERNGPQNRGDPVRIRRCRGKDPKFWGPFRSAWGSSGHLGVCKVCLEDLSRRLMICYRSHHRVRCHGTGSYLDERKSVKTGSKPIGFGCSQVPSAPGPSREFKPSSCAHTGFPLFARQMFSRLGTFGATLDPVPNLLRSLIRPPIR
jgi:hypothetical protein